MRATLSLFPALLLLAACQKQDPAPVAKASTTPASTPAAPALQPQTAEAKAVTVDEKTALYEYYFSYPAQAAGIPALKALMDGELAKARAELASEARESQEEAKRAEFDFRPHTRDVVWQVVTDLPGWLSLSATISVYSGGAHPNHWFGTMVWDRQAGRQREALDLFTSKQALSRAIRASFCDRIDAERAERRGEPVIRSQEGLFDDCIDPVEQTVILGSSNRRQFNRIGVLVPPYEAGPYAEGSYEVTLPVTAAVLAAVKPEYRDSFAQAR